MNPIDAWEVKDHPFWRAQSGDVWAIGSTREEAIEKVRKMLEGGVTSTLPPRATIVGNVPPALTDAECVERLVRNGWPAAADPTHGLVVRWDGRVCKVVGGDFVSPTIRLLFGVSPSTIVWTEPKA